MSSSFVKKVALAALLLAAGVATAQSEPVVAHVPFDFVVHGQHMPAGDYRIEPGHDPSVVLIRNWQGRDAMFVLTAPGEAPDMTRPDPVLIFGQYENSYRLESLWTPDGGRRDIPGSPASRKLATVKVPAQPAS